ncbi:hypothetical protein GYH30_030255 [Glycine max]|nr:hypothetical protein GYH30_030255 [Glycine max]
MRRLPFDIPFIAWRFTMLMTYFCITNVVARNWTSYK